jgi:hypothetical protein
LKPFKSHMWRKARHSERSPFVPRVPLVHCFLRVIQTLAQ